ncbi:hypothetical protein RhiJN_21259 [Ceratobasidium sp. AG-Ba]|nr:hypothetical protein RhiJN_21259 [Ceratobasidium sp. AG-Ba]
MVSEQHTANKITVNAAEQDDCIESVTVFQANRAEVKRRVKVKLKKGQNHIGVERLPSCINDNSIRVEGTGNAIIFDVVYHRQSSWSTPSSPDNPFVEAADEYRRALEALRKEREVAKQQSLYLESYGKALDNKSVADVERFLDMFAPRQLAVAKHMQDLDVKISQAEKAYSEAQAKTRGDPQDANRRTKITVTVLSEADGEAELFITYVVSNASWTPLYDARASIAKSPDTPSKVMLHYRASVTQTTGENWPDVALVLSTASPRLGGAVPKLSPWRIGFVTPHPSPPWRSSSYLSSNIQSQIRGATYDPQSLLEFTAEAPPPAMAYRSAEVTDPGVLNTSFKISGRSSIPTDQSSHKVIITVLDLKAEPEWVCVPREQESVYLQCKVINTSQFTLLPGEGSVFMDDNFVSKTSIEDISPNERFNISLGIDSALRVSYPPARTLNHIVNRSNFFIGNNPGTSVAARSQRITVRNTRPAPVTTLRIFDHVPVSTDDELKVTITSPSSLDSIRQTGVPGREDATEKESREHEWMNVKTGVKARWAPLDTRGEGTVEWECRVRPNEELELELAWQVDAPIGKNWENK